jgi:hypothetical protein
MSWRKVRGAVHFRTFAASFCGAAAVAMESMECRSGRQQRCLMMGTPSTLLQRSTASEQFYGLDFFVGAECVQEVLGKPQSCICFVFESVYIFLQK